MKCMIIGTSLLVFALGGCAMSVNDPDLDHPWNDGNDEAVRLSDPGESAPVQGQAPVAARRESIYTDVGPSSGNQHGEVAKPGPVPWLPGEDTKPDDPNRKP